MSLQAALRDRDDRRATEAAFTAGERVFTAFKDVYGPGIITFDLFFPALYTEKPAFTGCELELGPNEKITSIFPSATGVISGWHGNRVGAPEDQKMTYTGAKITALITGHPTQHSILHLRFEARSIANPLKRRA